MKIGVVGLGKMGNAIAYRLFNFGHDVYGFDLNEESVREAKRLGISIISDLKQLAQEVNVIWIMVPAGKPVDDVINEILPTFEKNSILIDGGNSHFTDSIRREEYCRDAGINFLDCGTSGGLHGKEVGFCLMVGGNKNSYEKVKPVLEAIAAPWGYAHIGPPGSGHYIKMIHNGIEYALLESYAQGFNLLKHGHYKNLNLEQISHLWLHGSIIRSWILKLIKDIFKRDQDFKNISGVIGGGQTGTWTVQEAHKHKIDVSLIEKSLEIRDESHQTGGNFETKLVALLRKEFGGHPIPEKK